MRRKAIVLTVVAILIIFGCLFVLSACRLTNHWICECYFSKKKYDINDVTFQFIYGYHNATYDYKMVDEYFQYSDEYDGNEEYPPVTMYLYFSSFGNEYLIKAVDDFFSEEYQDRNHKEDITVPAELFYNEYGLIEFYFTDTKTEPSEKTDDKKASCSFFYKKVGDGVYIGKNDFAPEYKYAFKDEIGSGANTCIAGFTSADVTKGNYCSFITASWREPDDATPLEIKFYAGSTLTENRAKSVEIYAEKQGQKLLMQTANDYDSDEYDCYFKYDYYGYVKEIVYAHKEKIYIPSEWITGKQGEIELYVYDTEKQEKLTSIAVKYEFKKIVFDDGYVLQGYDITRGGK